jgi:ABC-type transporter Mla MlaB component
VATAFASDGLRRGDKVLYLADSDDVAPLVRRLDQVDPAFGPAMAGGQLDVLRASDVYISDGRFDLPRALDFIHYYHDQALADGYTGLSITGEMPAAVREVPGGEQLTLYEARLERDRRQRGRPGSARYSMLCQYDHGRFGPAVLSDVAQVHQVDVSPELAAIGRDGEVGAAYDRARDELRLSGELDFACAQTVSDVLDAHFPGPLRVDLADLSYVDVAGMRALRGHTGRRLIITSASAAVRRLLALLAWDTDPGVELIETR